MALGFADGDKLGFDEGRNEGVALGFADGDKLGFKLG